MRTLAGVAAGLVLVAACSAGKQVADKIQSSLKESLGVDVSVDCPKEAKAEKGATFDCTATLGDKQLTYHIEFTDDTHFNADPAGAADTPEHAEEAVRGAIEAQGQTVDSVDCGTEPLFVPAGSSFNCNVSQGGQTVTFAFTVDADGNFTDVQPVS
jgi:hypothetical protein